MAKAVKKTNKPAPKKTPPPKTTTKVPNKPVEKEEIVPEAEVPEEIQSQEAPVEVDTVDGRNAKLMVAFPSLKQEDFMLYEGEVRYSLIARLAEKLGVTIDEVVRGQW